MDKTFFTMYSVYKCVADVAAIRMRNKEFVWVFSSFILSLQILCADPTDH